MKRLKKPLLVTLATLLALALVAVGAVCVLWHNEIATLASMKLLRERNDEHLDGAVYTMHVKGDFYLDDFVPRAA